MSEVDVFMFQSTLWNFLGHQHAWVNIIKINAVFNKPVFCAKPIFMTYCKPNILLT